MEKKTWDKYAPFYKRAARGDKQAYEFMFDRISKVVMGKDVLELATGPGLLARHVAPAAKSVVATDYSEGMIREAERGDVPANLVFEVADATALSYQDSAFDVVLIANALHIMDDPDAALREIRRVLKPDGLLIAPNYVNHDAGNSLWAGILKLAGVGFNHRWTQDTYPEYLGSQGWDVVFSKLMPARFDVLYTECVPA